MTVRLGCSSGCVFGTMRLRSTYFSISPAKSSVVTPSTCAPRALTSRTLAMVLSKSFSTVARATTSVSSSMRE